MKGRCPGPARRWGRAVKGVSTAKVPKCQAYVQKILKIFSAGTLYGENQTVSVQRPRPLLPSPSPYPHSVSNADGCYLCPALPHSRPAHALAPYIYRRPTPPRHMRYGRSTPFAAFHSGRTRQTHCKFTPAWVISSPCKNLAIHPPAPAALRVL